MYIHTFYMINYTYQNIYMHIHIYIFLVRVCVYIHLYKYVHSLIFICSASMKTFPVILTTISFNFCLQAIS